MKTTIVDLERMYVYCCVVVVTTIPVAFEARKPSVPSHTPNNWRSHVCHSCLFSQHTGPIGVLVHCLHSVVATGG